MRLCLQAQEGRFAAYLWRYVDGKPISNSRRSFKEIPVDTPLSDPFGMDLSRRGFKFVGATIYYTFMQAVGTANDHTLSFFR